MKSRRRLLGIEDFVFAIAMGLLTLVAALFFAFAVKAEPTIRVPLDQCTHYTSNAEDNIRVYLCTVIIHRPLSKAVKELYSNESYSRDPLVNSLYLDI